MFIFCCFQDKSENGALDIVETIRWVAATGGAHTRTKWWNMMTLLGFPMKGMLLCMYGITVKSCTYLLTSNNNLCMFKIRSQSYCIRLKHMHQYSNKYEVLVKIYFELCQDTWQVIDLDVFLFFLCSCVVSLIHQLMNYHCVRMEL